MLMSKMITQCTIVLIFALYLGGGGGGGKRRGAWPAASVFDIALGTLQKVLNAHKPILIPIFSLAKTSLVGRGFSFYIELSMFPKILVKRSL